MKTGEWRVKMARSKEPAENQDTALLQSVGREVSLARDSLRELHAAASLVVQSTTSRLGQIASSGHKALKKLSDVLAKAEPGGYPDNIEGRKKERDATWREVAEIHATATTAVRELEYHSLGRECALDVGHLVRVLKRIPNPYKRAARLLTAGMNTNGNKFLATVLDLLEALGWQLADLKFAARRGPYEGDRVASVNAAHKDFSGWVRIQEYSYRSCSVEVFVETRSPRAQTTLYARDTPVDFSFSVQPGIQWVSWSGSPEEGALFGETLLVWSKKLQAATAALAPLLDMTAEERKDGAGQVIRWVEEQASQEGDSR